MPSLSSQGRLDRTAKHFSHGFIAPHALICRAIAASIRFMSAGLLTDECADVDGLLIAPYEMAIMKIFENSGLNKIF